MRKTDLLHKSIFIYGIGLVCIFGLIILTIFLRVLIHDDIGQYTHLINLAGKQRMYSQRIASFTAQYLLGDKTVIPEIKESAQAFKDNQKFLSTFVEKNRDEKLKAIYFTGDHSLNNQVAEYSELANRVTTLSLTDPTLRKISSQLFQLSRDSLLRQLDATANLFEQETIDLSNELDHILIIIRATFFVIFIFITFVIFHYLFQIKRELEKTEHEMIEMDKRYQLMINSVRDYAIFLMDKNGNIKTWNKGAEQIKGYRSDEVVGKNFSIFYTKEDIECKHPQEELANAAKNGRYEEEGWRICKGGKIIWADILISAIYNEKNELIGFCKVTKDLTERRELDVMKNEFITVINHELRTPLTSIRGALGLLKSGIADHSIDKVHDLLKIADKNSDRLLKLINTLLDFEKISSGKLTLNLKEVDICEVIEESISNNQAYADKFNISVEFTKKTQFCWVTVDRDRLLQVFTNLIMNAVKFSTENKPVVISMGTKEDRVKINIFNEGPIISEAFQKRIFHHFSQRDSSEVKEKSGIGLGLSISKILVEKMNGVIGFTSENGKTHFFIEFPFRKNNEKRP